MNDTMEGKNPEEEDGEKPRPLKLLQEFELEMEKSDSCNGVFFPTSSDSDEDDDEEEEDDSDKKQQYENTSFDNENENDGDATDSETSEEYEEYQEKLYSHPGYPNNLFQALDKMKRLSFLTDLTLRTQSEVHYHAHSLVLAAVSSLVQQALQHANETNKREIFLYAGPEVSDLGLSAVLEFAYSGTISALNRETSAQIQAAALYLGVPRVLELCTVEEAREWRKDGKKKMEGKNSRISADEQKKVSLQSIKQLWDERVGCDVEVEAEGRIFCGRKT